MKCTDKVTNDGNSDFIAKNIRMRKSTDFEWPKMGERTTTCSLCLQMEVDWAAADDNHPILRERNERRCDLI